MKMRANNTNRYSGKYERKKGLKIDPKTIKEKKKNDKFSKVSIGILVFGVVPLSLIEYAYNTINSHAGWGFCDTKECSIDYIFSSHPHFVFLCKILAALIIFISAFLGFFTSRQENAEIKKKYTRIAVMFAASSAFLSVDTMSQGVKTGIVSLIYFTGLIDFIMHFSGIILFFSTVISFYMPKIYKIIADD